MIRVKVLRDLLSRFPDDSKVAIYEGEWRGLYVWPDGVPLSESEGEQLEIGNTDEKFEYAPPATTAREPEPPATEST